MTAAKRRRKRPKTRRLVQLSLSAVVLAVLLYGFAHWTRVVLDIEAHRAMLDAHPFDWYADGCLGLALVLLATLLLSRPAPPPTRWKARGMQKARPVGGKPAKRMRRHRVQ